MQATQTSHTQPTQTTVPLADCILNEAQCLKWSKKEAGSLPQSEVECRWRQDQGAVGKSKNAGSHFKPWWRQNNQTNGVFHSSLNRSICRIAQQCKIHNIWKILQKPTTSQSSSASDPDYAIPNRPHFHSAGFLCQGSWRLPRHWRYHDDTCQGHCSVMLRRTPTDPQRAAFSVSTRLADTYPCSCCQQGRLLLLCVDRCLRSSPKQTIQSIFLSWTLPLV